MDSYLDYKGNFHLSFLIKNLNKIIFFIILASRTLIVLSSPSWIVIWIGLEINLLSFIPLIKDKNNSLSSERITKYFIIQSIASTLLLFSILNYFLLEPKIIIFLAILIKLGIVPFHFWYPIIIEGLSWINCLILATWQKIGPIIIISHINNIVNTSIIFIISTNILRRISRINFSRIRKLIAYSSINNIRWILPTILISKSIWIIYFLIYLIISSRIIINLNIINSSIINQIFLYKFSFKWNIPIILRFLSIAGLPPLLGFIPKWISIQVIIRERLYLLSILIIISTIVLIFSYTRIIFTSTLLINFEKSWQKIKHEQNKPFIVSINFFRLLPWTLAII